MEPSIHDFVKLVPPPSLNDYIESAAGKLIVRAGHNHEKYISDRKNSRRARKNKLMKLVHEKELIE